MKFNISNQKFNKMFIVFIAASILVVFPVNFIIDPYGKSNSRRYPDNRQEERA